MPFIGPSARTATTWTRGFVRHAVRIELFILIMSIFGLVFGIAASVTSVQRLEKERTRYYYLAERYTFIYLIYILPPVITLVVTIGNLLIFCKFCLHPVYSLSWSIFALLGWIVTFIFSLASGAFQDVPYRGSSIAARVLCAIASALFIITACGFFSYMVIAAIGVDRFRTAGEKRERKDVQLAAAAASSNTVNSSQTVLPPPPVPGTMAAPAPYPAPGPGPYAYPGPPPAMAAAPVQHIGHVEGDGRRCVNCYEHAEYYS